MRWNQRSFILGLPTFGILGDARCGVKLTRVEQQPTIETIETSETSEAGDVSTSLFCPECRAEYLASATTCADCGVPLVSAAALESAAAEALPPANELHCVRAAALGWAQKLSDLLAEAGISHRIEVAQDDEDDGSVRRPGANLPYGVYVRAEDLEAAAEVDAEFMRSQLPDLHDHGATGTSDADGGESCPACGAEVTPDARECPDCGLALLVG